MPATNKYAIGSLIGEGAGGSVLSAVSSSKEGGGAVQGSSLENTENDTINATNVANLIFLVFIVTQ